MCGGGGSFDGARRGVVTRDLESSLLGAPSSFPSKSTRRTMFPSVASSSNPSHRPRPRDDPPSRFLCVYVEPTATNA